MIECKECGKECISEFHLAKHLARYPINHCTPQEYYDKYILKDDNNKKCHRRTCLNQTSFNGIIHGYNKYCSPSCCNKEKATDPEYRLKNKNAQIIAQNKPEVKQRSRDTASAQWKDPDVRRRTLSTYQQTLNKPGIRERYSEASKNRWTNSEYRNKYIQSMQKHWKSEDYKKEFKKAHNTEESKLNHSVASKKLWQNQLFRDRMISFLNSSDHKKYMSDLVTVKMLNGEWNPGHGCYHWGYCYSEKNNSFMFHRSGTELTAFQLLDINPLVKSFDYEPLRISYIDKDGNTKFCIPDLMIHYIDNSLELVEIKPDVFVNDEDIQLKLKAMSEYCIKIGIKFRVWLESEIVNRNTKQEIVIMATYQETMDAINTKIDAFKAAAATGVDNKTAALQARKLSMELRADLQGFRKASVDNDRANTKHREPKAATATVAEPAVVA